MEYFTADPHFGHANIIKHCNRPFATAQAMDDTILSYWNARLKPGDRLYIIGDFCGQRRPFETIMYYLSRIHLNPANIVLILGNHDNEQACRKVFHYVHDIYRFKRRIETGLSQHIVLCHYAMRTWAGSHRGSWHLYGHSHDTLPELEHSLSFDIGVDANGFHLLSYDQVAARIAEKTFRPVDHHVREDEETQPAEGFEEGGYTEPDRSYYDRDTTLERQSQE